MRGRKGARERKRDGEREKEKERRKKKWERMIDSERDAVRMNYREG